MTVVLSGGIDQRAAAAIAARLLDDTVGAADVERSSNRGASQIGVLIRGPEPALVLAELQAVFGDGSCQLVELWDELEPARIQSLDALVVADGDAAELLAACEPVVADIRGAVHRGRSFWGIGAGAAIAAETAIVGGYTVGGVQVAPRLSTDAVPEVEIAPGLGLIDIAVLPGAAQLGRLGIGIALCEAEVLDRVIGLDGDTSLVISEGQLGLHGTGSMWELSAGPQGAVTVTTRAAAES